MEISFLGGASEVGRSGFLLKGSKSILLDYGLKIDERTEYPLDVDKVDAVVISHAHLDHSGSLPYLFRKNNPIVIGTDSTLELSNLLIEDAMKLGRKKHEPLKYKNRDLKMLNRRYVPYPYHSTMNYDEFDITLYDAGHICGSAITLIEDQRSNKRIVYTGDFKLEKQLFHDGAEIVKSDILIIESTYATREHPDRKVLIKKFIEEIKKILDNNGVALVPVFAVGRSQEILGILYENNLIDYVYLDGMARKATDIVLRHPNEISKSDMLKKAIERLMWVDSKKDRRSASDGPSIVVTTSGMLNGGPVLNYLKNLSKNSEILLTGYQIEGTNGRRLLEKGSVVIDNKEIKIENPVHYFDFSAHAGESDLYKYVKESNPETVICIHGDRDNVKIFSEKLKEMGFETYAPEIGERIKLKV